MTRVRIPWVSLKNRPVLAHYLWWSQQGSLFASEGEGKCRDEWKNEDTGLLLGGLYPSQGNRSTESFEECPKFGHLKETV